MIPEVGFTRLPARYASELGQARVPRGGNRFSEKIMLKQDAKARL
jgi:hypothetical protein